jgi:anaerobic magnesium-protoporphyrin IX monomethyl ester cyclase
MKILLLNPPHDAIGSRVPKEHLPPFGLLCLGGPLIDAGHDVQLLNADRLNLKVDEISQRIQGMEFDAILIGHSGSSSAHPIIIEIANRARQIKPDTKIIYGGVYPTYHWKDVLEECPQIDVIVRGEGEETALRLVEALQAGQPLKTIAGIAFRLRNAPYATRPAPMIADLDAYRIGWELIDFDDYSYWGGKKSVILQFSRGCPHLCTYCGQRGFWTKWRHRDPVKLAQEIAMLHREHGVELINFADENPTSSRRLWKAFLEALIAENVPVTLIGSTRAGDIARDADILHLYKKAGVLRFLLGIEALNEETLTNIRKGSKPSTDQEAISLLRSHGMIGLCTFAVGFEEETDRDYFAMLRQLLRYDPDQIMSVFATPHRWTPFFEASKHRRVIQTDFRLWDYEHQVIETKNVPAWRLFLWVKLIELIVQLRPKAIWRNFLHPDPDIRHAMRWYTRMGRRVVLREFVSFFFQEKRAQGPTVAQFFGGDVQLVEEAHAKPVRIERELSHQR